VGLERSTEPARKANKGGKYIALGILMKFQSKVPNIKRPDNNFITYHFMIAWKRAKSINFIPNCSHLEHQGALLTDADGKA